MDLWKECAQWMYQHKLVPSNHPLFRAEASYMEFVNLIRDGVLLCKLLNKIKPGSIPTKDMVLRPQLSQVLCIRNISTFITCCIQKFGVQEEDAFEPYMLFDYADVGKVIYMLSKLSQCEKATATGISGFPTHNLKKKEVIDVFKTVGDQLNITESDLYDKFNIYEAQSDQENVYDNICATFKIYSSQEETFRTTPYANVISELYDSEVSYVETLNTLENTFKTSLKLLMAPIDFDAVFFRISDLCSIHMDFRGELFDYFYGLHDLSEIFFRFRNRFLIYADYCANLQTAQAKVLELSETSARFRQTMEATQRKVKGQFSLHDILSVPFQRLLKYPLMIKKLISDFEGSDNELQQLHCVDALLIDISEHCNEVKRDKENREQVTKIEECITDFKQIFTHSLTKYGKLLKEGEVTCTYPDSKVRRAHLLLFEMNVLICESEKGSETKLVYKNGLLIPNTKVEILETKKKKKPSFTLTEVLRKLSFIITLQTADQRTVWMDLITTAKLKLLPEDREAGNHKFRLHTFVDHTFCTICDQLLRGLVHQGYKCTNDDCENSVHGVCIQGCQPCGVRSPTVNVSPFQRFIIACQDNSDVTQSSISLVPDYVGSRKFSDTALSHAESRHTIIETFPALCRIQGSLYPMSPDQEDEDFKVERNAMLSSGGSPNRSQARLPRSGRGNVIPGDQHQSSAREPFQNIHDAAYSSRDVVPHMWQPPARNSSGNNPGPPTLPPPPPGALDYYSNIFQPPQLRSSPPIPPPKPNKSGVNIKPFSKISNKASTHVISPFGPNPEVLNQLSLLNNEFVCKIQDRSSDEQRTPMSSEKWDPDADKLQKSQIDYQMTPLPPSPADDNTVYEEVTIPMINPTTPGWVGRIDSKRAQSLLEGLPDGTYLIRERLNGDFALSLQYQGSVRHLRVYVLETKQVCLAAVKKFDSIESLVHFYRRNNLKEIFDHLDTCLLLPYPN